MADWARGLICTLESEVRVRGMYILLDSESNTFDDPKRSMFCRLGRLAGIYAEVVFTFRLPHSSSSCRSKHSNLQASAFSQRKCFLSKPYDEAVNLYEILQLTSSKVIMEDASIVSW